MSSLVASRVVPSVLTNDVRFRDSLCQRIATPDATRIAKYQETKPPLFGDIPDPNPSKGQANVGPSVKRQHLGRTRRQRDAARHQAVCAPGGTRTQEGQGAV